MNSRSERQQQSERPLNRRSQSWQRPENTADGYDKDSRIQPIQLRGNIQSRVQSWPKTNTDRARSRPRSFHGSQEPNPYVKHALSRQSTHENKLPSSREQRPDEDVSEYEFSQVLAQTPKRAVEKVMSAFNGLFDMGSTSEHETEMNALQHQIKQTRERANREASVHEGLRDENEKLKAELRKRDEEVRSLQKKLTEEKNKMQSFGHLAEQALSTERARSQQEVVKRDESIRSAKAESKIIQQEIEDLRQIIQKNPDQGEPLDNTVVMAFQGIARSIQALVRKCCPNASKPDLSNSKSYIKDRFQNDSMIPGREKLMLRAELFNIFEAAHFGKPIFGADGETEAALRKVERRLQGAHLDSPLDVVEWRRRTVSCLAAIQDRPTSDTGCERSIVELLLPVVGNVKDVHIEAEKRVRSLCEEMYAFAILLRQSRSTFQIVREARGTLIQSPDPDFEVELLLDGSTEDDSGNIVGAKVAWTLFGGLRKIHYKRGDQIILVAPKVVLRR